MNNQEMGDNATIYIVDGQNQSEIQHVLNDYSSRYNPCLPSRILKYQHITITFDPYKIKEFEDWYPSSVCRDMEDKGYMFGSMGSMTINNLNINDVTTIYSIMYVHNHTATLTCNNCSFINITSLSENALLQTFFRAYISNSNFVNIKTSNQIIHIGRQNFKPGEDRREISFFNTTFSDITADSVLDATGSVQEVQCLLFFGFNLT